MYDLIEHWSLSRMKLRRKTVQYIVRHYPHEQRIDMASSRTTCSQKRYHTTRVAAQAFGDGEICREALLPEGVKRAHSCRIVHAKHMDSPYNGHGEGKVHSHGQCGHCRTRSMPRKTAVRPVVIGVPGDDLPLSHRKPTLLLPMVGFATAGECLNIV